MQRGRLLLQFLLLFGVVLLAYILIFRWIEGRRVAKGPWQVTFSTEAGRPELRITQASLSLQEVRILFLGVTAPSNGVERVAFNKAQNPPYPVPFGECVFQDLLFLPGTVTLKLFGHEIQMLPRTLTINHVERPWRSGEVIELPALTNPAVEQPTVGKP